MLPLRTEYRPESRRLCLAPMIRAAFAVVTTVIYAVFVVVYAPFRPWLHTVSAPAVFVPDDPGVDIDEGMA